MGALKGRRQTAKGEPFEFPLSGVCPQFGQGIRLPLSKIISFAGAVIISTKRSSGDEYNQDTRGDDRDTHQNDNTAFYNFPHDPLLEVETETP